MNEKQATVHVDADLLKRAQQAISKKLGVKVRKSDTAKEALLLLIKESTKK